MQIVQDYNEYAACLSKFMQTTPNNLNLVKPSPPKMYPCVVAFALSQPVRIMACYFYPSDALRLLSVATLKAVNPAFPLPTATASPSGPASPVDPEPSYEPPMRSNKEQVKEYQKHISAMLLTLVQELVDVGITSQERFETKMQANLAQVDQKYAENLDLHSLYRPKDE